MAFNFYNCDGNPGGHGRELFQKEVSQVVVGGRGKTKEEIPSIVGIGVNCDG